MKTYYTHHTSIWQRRLKDWRWEKICDKKWNNRAMIYVMILEAIYAVNATMTVHKTRLISLASSLMSLAKSFAWLQLHEHATRIPPTRLCSLPHQFPSRNVASAAWECVHPMRHGIRDERDFISDYWEIDFVENTIISKNPAGKTVHLQHKSF